MLGEITRNSLFLFAIYRSHRSINMAAFLRCLIVLLAVSISLRRTTAATVTVEEACKLTKHPEFCVKALTSSTPAIKTDAAAAGAGGLQALAEHAVSIAAEGGTSMVSFVKNLTNSPGGMPPECLEQCVAKFQAAVAELKRCEVALEQYGGDKAGVKAWVMAAQTDGDSCMVGCHKVEGGADPEIEDKIGDLDKLCSIALSLTDASVRNGTAPAA